MTFAHQRIRASYEYARLRRKLFGVQSIADAAERSWEIAPAETIETPPCVALPGQVDKIRKIERRTTEEIERRRLEGGPFERPPVRAWRLVDAVLYRGCIFAGRAEKRILPFEYQPAASSQFPLAEFDEAALAGSYLGLQFFGHWLKDDAPLSLMASEFGAPISPTPPSWHSLQFADSHIPGYHERLQLPWRQAENAICKRITLFDDEDFTTHKGARLRALRNRTGATERAAAPGKRVFIKRGIVDREARWFRNETEIVDRLAEDGVLILDPAKCSVSELAQAVNGAELVLGAEGSHQVHALYFLPRGAGLLAITAPDRFATVNKRWTDLIGVRYGVLVGDPADEGFTVDFDELRRTIDLFDR